MLYPTSFEHNSIWSFSWPQVTENNGGIPTFNLLHKLTGSCELEMASEWKEMKHIAAHHPKTVASSASHLSIMQMSDAFLNGTDSNRRKLLWLRPLQHGKSHQIFKRFLDCAYPTSKQGHPRASLLTLKWINSKIPRTRKAWGSDQATSAQLTAEAVELRVASVTLTMGCNQRNELCKCPLNLPNLSWVLIFKSY